MRAIFSALILAVIFLSACTDSQTKANEPDDQAQKNLEAARKIAKAFETGDASLIDSVVADDFVDHTDRGVKVGKDSLKAMVNFVRTNFKDMKGETIKEMADGDYVFQLIRYTGTSDGTMGMPAGPYDMHTMEVSRYKDGKAVEHWAYMEVSEMMKMMGMPPAKPATDTASSKPKN
jgi:predicted SnoaL-like aldol condensation-catalyzing enzyme